MSYALGWVGDEIDLSFRVTAFRIPAGSGDENRSLEFGAVAVSGGRRACYSDQRTAIGAALDRRPMASQSQSIPKPASVEA